MALAAIIVAQDRRGLFLAGDQGRSLGFDHRQGIAVRAVRTVAVAVEPLAARRTVILGGAVLAGTLVAGAIIPRPVVAGAVVGPGAFVTGTVVGAGRSIVALLRLALAPGAIVAVAPTVAAAVLALALTLAFETVGARPIVTLAVVTGPIVALPVIARALVAPAFAARLLALAFAAFGVVAFGFGGRGVRGGGGLGAALILEIDVEAGGDAVAPQDIAGRTRGLHGPHHPEIVLGVLQVVLRQHPVAG